MESQVVHSHGRVHEHDPNTVGLHSVVEGEDQGGEHGHHEKKSVLKKVKAKAKKLKDTITKHGHGHDHDHDKGHAPDDHDLEEEDDEDEDEEMIEDPEVHGAPMYESTAMRAAVLRPTATEKDDTPPFERSHEHAAGGFGESWGRPKAEYGGTMPIDEGPRAPTNTPEATVPLGTTGRAADPARTFVDEKPDPSKVNLTWSEGLEKDPEAPKDREELYSPSNYQTKVADPTGSGGHEAKIMPLDQSFGAMHIQEKTETKPTQVPGGSMGSHDQFSPEPVTRETESLLESKEPLSETNSGKEVEAEKPSSQQTSYTEKISSATSAATSAVANKAAAAKNLLTSKLGYGTSGPEGEAKESKSGDQSPRQGGGYAEKISSVTHAIADKASLVTNLVAAKIGYGHKEDPMAHESSGVTETHSNDNPTAQSSYTGKIAAVAGTAKDAVASKLGYGKKGDDVAESASGMTEEEKSAAGQDKGVSVRDYLAEKLKPGEEDKALSEVISSAFDKRKKEAEKPVVVTASESEEVSQYLGEGGQGQMSSPRKAVVDKLKGAVGSWFGKSSDQSHGSEAVPMDTTPEEQTGERRLQESTS